jgi:hypothetical protein
MCGRGGGFRDVSYCSELAKKMVPWFQCVNAESGITKTVWLFRLSVGNIGTQDSLVIDSGELLSWADLNYFATYS